MFSGSKFISKTQLPINRFNGAKFFSVLNFTLRMFPFRCKSNLMGFNRFGKSTIKPLPNMSSSYYMGKEKSIEEICQHLSKYTGGSVDLLKRIDGLAIVILNHERKKNAMSGKMMVDLMNIVEELGSWSSGKGLVLKGSGGNFCSGGDLDFVRQTGTAEEGFMMATLMQNVLNKFQKLPMVSVALVEGAGALGGGSEITLFCDFALITETCRGIGFLQAKMGIVPAWGGTNKLVEKIGYSKALDCLLTSRMLSPQECLHLGLVNDIIPANEDPEDFAFEWLEARTQFDLGIIKCMKQSALYAKDNPRDFENERRLFAPLWGGKAQKEALQKTSKQKGETSSTGKM